ncbi:MAG: MATE family efflux transporter [Selenomonadaceae bacterium]|nr:MATE family efflux transporter [Selenomonadaceae bacterium]
MREDFFSTVGEIIKYGGSTFAALVAMSIYMTTDGFFIGNWVGTEGLEAMALIFPITVVFSAFGTLFETGSSAVVSKIIGEGRKSLSEGVMRSNYLCAFVIGIIVAVVGNIFIKPLLEMLSNNPEELYIIDMAVSFLRISFWGLPFLLMIYLTGAFMRCIEKPTHVFYFVGATSILNIILDALFIIVFGWGMEGAALATVIAQIFGALNAFWYFKYSRQKFSSSSGFEGFEYVFEGIKVGAGFAIATLMVCFLEYFMNAILLYYDATHLLAALTVSNIILTFIYLPLNGLDTGIQPLMSRLYASNEKVHCMRVMRYGFFLTVVLTFAIYFVLMMFTEELMRFFVNSNEPITEAMIDFLKFTFLLQPFVGIYTWMSGIMAALEDEWRNVVLSLSPLVIQVPLICLLPKFLPIEYVALNYSIQDLADALIAFLLIRSFLKEKGLSFKKIFNAR